MKITADSYIPFLQGRLEPYCHIDYVRPDLIDAARVKDSDALLIRTRTRCAAPLLEHSRVSLVATCTIGMDQMDLPWLAQRGIEARNAPGCNAPGVAQYVWSALLHMDLDPAALTIGVVGHGHVGSIVAEWGRHLGARVLLCDPPKARALKARGQSGEQYMTLHEMLPLCDVVTLHTPLTREGEDATFHLVGERELSLMRPGSWLVNAARGPVLDNGAALRHPAINYIIDTWEGEPQIAFPALLEQARIATPHVAGYSLQGKQRATRMALEAVARHFSLPLAPTPGRAGIKVWDLPEPYRPIEGITAAEIYASYDPMADDAALRSAPEALESLRDNYDFRSEPAAALKPSPQA